MYFPTLVKKVVRKYIGTNELYSEAKLDLFQLKISLTSWVIYIVKSQESSLEFHFIKNGNHDYVKKMPIHSIKVWVHELGMVVVFLEDLRRKKQVGLVYPCIKMYNDLIFYRGFKIGGLASQTTKDITEQWTNFHKLWMPERMESQEETTK
jgi:hypothetical protein